MLRFTVDPASESFVAVDVNAGYLIGASDQSIAGRMRKSGGLIECEVERKRAAGVNVQCRTKEMGRLSLSTCLLEQRDEPYSLLLELARHRIKQFIAKCEDWQIWDHPAASAALAQWNEARRHFTQAMTTSDRAAADQLSTKALVAGIKASEKLAMAHAQILMHRRYATKPAAKLVLGVRLDESFDATVAAEGVKLFDMVSVPLVWAEIEPKPGQFDFRAVEGWLAAAERAGRTVMVGPVVDLRPSAVPPWLAKRRGDFTFLRDSVWNLAQALGGAMAHRVGMWNIATGLNDNEWWPLKLEEMVEVARRATVALRQSRKNVPTLIEIARPFGHAVGARKWAVTPRSLVDALDNDGIHIDCLLVQILMGEPGMDHLTRDLLEVSNLLDTYIPFRKPVFVELGAPSAPLGKGLGYWRAPWNPKSQSVWAARMFSIAISKPHVEMVLWHGLCDGAKSTSGRGVLAVDRQHKPALGALVELRNSLRTPLGQLRDGTAIADQSSASAGAADGE